MMKGIEPLKLHHLSKNLYWMFIAGICAALVMINPVAAGADVFSTISDISADVYDLVKGLSTPFLGAVVGVSQLVYMFSGNPKMAEPAKDWRNRAIIGWVVINGIGLVVNTIQPWIEGGGTLS